jgi:amidase
MKISEYVELDGLGLAELVRRGQVTATEVLEVACAALDQVNPRLNAVVESLRAEAEQEIRNGLPTGPFTGVPFLIKALGPFYAGKPTSMGSRLFQQYVAPFDSELMARYRRAGLVTLGKTNLPEFGLSFSTEPELYGPCKNPWHLEHSPGGSSGGAAAAVAARMVPMAHGNDAGGSIRVPASTCGLFGFKPTRGRMPTGPFGEAVFGLAVDHALTRSVRDSAALLDATLGEDAGPPYGAPTPARPFLTEVTCPPGRLRIALVQEGWNGERVSPDCQEAVNHAAQLCRSLGHEIVPARPTVDGKGIRDVFRNLMCVFVSHFLDDFCPQLHLVPDASNIELTTHAWAAHGRSLTANQLAGTFGARNMLARGLGRFFTKFDLILSPTLAQTPIPLGAFRRDHPSSAEALIDSLFAFSPFTALFNLTGTPAMSVPLYATKSGQPVGIQFAAPFAADATLFRLAGQLEQAAPWAHQKPACVAQ